MEKNETDNTKPLVVMNNRIYREVLDLNDVSSFGRLRVMLEDPSFPHSFNSFEQLLTDVLNTQTPTGKTSMNLPEYQLVNLSKFLNNLDSPEPLVMTQTEKNEIIECTHTILAGNPTILNAARNITVFPAPAYQAAGNGTKILAFVNEKRSGNVVEGTVVCQGLEEGRDAVVPILSYKVQETGVKICESCTPPKFSNRYEWNFTKDLKTHNTFLQTQGYRGIIMFNKLN